jgi:hypothetical protein
VPTFRSNWRAISVLAGFAAMTCLGFADAAALPSYSRQTKLPCSACHTQFPELNDFGRSFKMSGYVLRAIESIIDSTPGGREDLSLSASNVFSAMFLASMTQTRTAQPGSQNGSVLLPDQLSVFLSGAITSKIGAFVQVTFDPQSGAFGLDNADVRYATYGTLAGAPMLYGVSINNNPTAQDLWNSTPVWGFPFSSSSLAPAPAAAAIVDGSLGQAVAGLNAYGYWNQTVYAEIGGYRSSPFGVRQPLGSDSAATDVISGVAPYWRVALTKAWGNNSAMLGTYGMVANLFPGGGQALSGPTNRHTDLALDLQYQRTMGHNSLTVAGTWIHEKQRLDAAFANGEAEATAHTLDTYRARATLHLGRWLGLTAAPFAMTGTADTLLYAPAALGGSRTGGPNTSGLIGEVDVMPWQNVRLALQYTAYAKFNGASTNYDGSGRSASANNTLYASVWLMY